MRFRTNRTPSEASAARLAAGTRRIASGLRWIMTHGHGVEDTGAAFGIKFSPVELMELQGMLGREVDSTKCFGDAMPAIERLQERGIRVGICSSLAGPYCSPNRSLRPSLDVCVMSAGTRGSNLLRNLLNRLQHAQYPSWKGFRLKGAYGRRLQKVRPIGAALLWDSGASFRSPWSSAAPESDQLESTKRYAGTSSVL